MFPVLCSFPQLDVLREGQPLRFEIPLMRPSPLVPHHLNGGDPSYLVVAGIVFTVVTGERQGALPAWPALCCEIVLEAGPGNGPIVPPAHACKVL